MCPADRRRNADEHLKGDSIVKAIKRLRKSARRTATRRVSRAAAEQRANHVPRFRACGTGFGAVH